MFLSGAGAAVEGSREMNPRKIVCGVLVAGGLAAPFEALAHSPARHKTCKWLDELMVKTTACHDEPEEQQRRSATEDGFNVVTTSVTTTTTTTQPPRWF
jgi:hypothetical protein